MSDQVSGLQNLCTERTHVHRTTFTYVILKPAVRTHTVTIAFVSTLYKWYATLCLPEVHYLLHIFLQMFGAIVYNTFCNFKYFNFLNCFKIKKTIKDLCQLFQITSVPRQTFRGVLVKSYSEYTLQICRKRIMPFIGWSHSSIWFFSCKLAAYFQKTFS